MCLQVGDGLVGTTNFLFYFSVKIVVVGIVFSNYKTIFKKNYKLLQDIFLAEKPTFPKLYCFCVFY